VIDFQGFEENTGFGGEDLAMNSIVKQDHNNANEDYDKALL